MRYLKIFLDKNCQDVYLKAYLQDDYGRKSVVTWQRPKRPALIICPGGAYYHLAAAEGEPVVWPFMAAGFNVFVLNYSVGKCSIYPYPLLDLAKAILHLRQNAEKYHIFEDKIATLGFSAGGNLIGMLGNHWSDSSLADMLACNSLDLRPNAQIFAYTLFGLKELGDWLTSVKNLYISLKKVHSDEEALSIAYEQLNLLTTHKMGHIMVQQPREMNIYDEVNEKTPPSFIWHTQEDKLVPLRQPLKMAQALSSKAICCEFHLFSGGRHGLSLANIETDFSGYLLPRTAYWSKLAINWLQEVLKF